MHKRIQWKKNVSKLVQLFFKPKKKFKAKKPLKNLRLFGENFQDIHDTSHI